MIVSPLLEPQQLVGTQLRGKRMKVRDRDEDSDCRRPRDKPFYWGVGGMGVGEQFYLGK